MAENEESTSARSNWPGSLAEFWRLPPRPLAPDPARVDVWRGDLLDLENHLELLEAVLEEEERARADRFRFERDRRRFVLCRGWLRVLLAAYVSCPPRGVRFRFGPSGKPALASDLSGRPLEFNLSHSGDLVLLAVTTQRRLGVDVERIRSDRASEEIARRFFSREEVASLLSLPESLRTAAFFRCWTRKEAYVKARGEGLSIPLDQFAVSLRPDEPAVLLRAEAGEASRWTLCDVPAGPGYSGALAVEGNGWELALWRTPPDLPSK